MCPGNRVGTYVSAITVALCARGGNVTASKCVRAAVNRSAVAADN